MFYYLTYEGACQLDSIDDPITKQAIESQIRNFGQTPSQLLTEPHPPRSSPLSITPMMFTQHNDDVCMIMKFLSNAPVIFVSANTQLPVYLSQSLAAAAASPGSASHFQQCVVTISSKHEFSVNKYNPSAAQPSATNAINNYNAYTEQQQKDAQTSETKSSTAIQSQNLTQTINATQMASHIQQLPLIMDQLLAFNTGLHKRQLGENFDDKLSLNQNNFIVTYDNRLGENCDYPGDGTRFNHF